MHATKEYYENKIAALEDEIRLLKAQRVVYRTWIRGAEDWYKSRFYKKPSERRLVRVGQVLDILDPSRVS